MDKYYIFPYKKLLFLTELFARVNSLKYVVFHQPVLPGIYTQ